jgi:hypothetical protein
MISFPAMDWIKSVEEREEPKETTGHGLRK